MMEILYEEAMFNKELSEKRGELIHKMDKKVAFLENENCRLSEELQSEKKQNAHLM